ncbi:hypothetical protein GQR58_028666 [Nymphon striatum]|nr:hypothetical protein GQR58_028666 [Nymphon striatum]
MPTYCCTVLFPGATIGMEYINSQQILLYDRTSIFSTFSQLSVQVSQAYTAVLSWWGLQENTKPRRRSRKRAQQNEAAKNLQNKLPLKFSPALSPAQMSCKQWQETYQTPLPSQQTIYQIRDEFNKTESVHSNLTLPQKIWEPQDAQKGTEIPVRCQENRRPENLAHNPHFFKLFKSVGNCVIYVRFSVLCGVVWCVVFSTTGVGLSTKHLAILYYDRQQIKLPPLHIDIIQTQKDDQNRSGSNWTLILKALVILPISMDIKMV